MRKGRGGKGVGRLPADDIKESLGTRNSKSKQYTYSYLRNAVEVLVSIPHTLHSYISPLERGLPQSSIFCELQLQRSSEAELIGAVFVCCQELFCCHS